jgi:hypothetical protein
LQQSSQAIANQLGWVGFCFWYEWADNKSHTTTPLLIMKATQGAGKLAENWS